MTSEEAYVSQGAWESPFTSGQVIYDTENIVNLRSQFSQWTEIIRIYSCFHSIPYKHLLVVLTANFLLFVLFIMVRKAEFKRIANELLLP